MTIEEAWNLLHLPESITESILRRAYREQARKWHPDAWHQDADRAAEAHLRMVALNAAYELLGELLKESGGSAQRPSPTQGGDAEWSDAGSADQRKDGPDSDTEARSGGERTYFCDCDDGEPSAWERAVGTPEGRPRSEFLRGGSRQFYGTIGAVLVCTFVYAVAFTPVSEREPSADKDASVTAASSDAATEAKAATEDPFADLVPPENRARYAEMIPEDSTTEETVMQGAFVQSPLTGKKQAVEVGEGVTDGELVEMVKEIRLGEVQALDEDPPDKPELWAVEGLSGGKLWVLLHGSKGEVLHGE